jgi:exonuclease 1
MVYLSESSIVLAKENTLFSIACCFCYRSVLRPREPGKFRCAPKKMDQVPPSKSSCTSDNEKVAGGPDISAFAYRPVKTSDQGKIITGNAINAPLDPGTFAYRSMPSTVFCTEQSKFTGTNVGTVDTPPVLSTFAYKPTKTAARRTEGSRLAGVTLKALRGSSRSQFKK